MTDGLHNVKPASQLIRKVEAVPTVFPLIDWRVGVGGFPISRITVIHGPSNMGKSTLCLGLIRSFLEAEQFVHYIDAERSTPKPFALTMIGEAFYSPLFTCPEEIGTYEQVRVNVRSWCESIAKARRSGNIPEDATGLVVVDSLRNLVPAGIFDELSKAFKADVSEAAKKKPKSRYSKSKDKGIDGASGRAGQIQAAYNTAWLVELSSLLADTRTALVAIAREEVFEGTGMFDRDRVEVRGGREVQFAPSLRLRVTAHPIIEGPEGAKQFVGERHGVAIFKTKLAGKTDTIPEGHFHTSNGTISPEGFDRARDVLELGLELGVITLAGAWYAFGAERLGQGADNVLTRLRGSQELLMGVEQTCRQAFGLRTEK